MKKVLVAAALIGVISFAGISMVDAHGRHGFGPERGYGVGDGYGMGYGKGYCRNWTNNGQDKEKVAAFLDETKETRKQITVKKSERRALMKQDNPDEKRVAQLSGEIFDLKEMMAEKSKKVFGDNAPPFGLMHHREGRGRGNCDGRGPQNF
jgi:hypothetical protein